MQSVSGDRDTWILYDGDCPFCRNYVSFLKLKAVLGEVRLIDARQAPMELEQVRAAGLYIDEGMVLCRDGRLYHGDECMHILATLSEREDLLGKLYAWVFGSSRRSAWLYPLLRAGRSATLRLLGKRKIES